MDGIIGGLKAIEAINKEKATILYDFLDGSNMFKSPVKKKDRSIMNITFSAPSDELNTKFIAEAQKQGMGSLTGHRSDRWYEGKYL